jgi:hypothetical protein
MNETFATKDPTGTANYFPQRNQNVTSIYTPRQPWFVCSLSRLKPTQFNAFNDTLTVYNNGRFTITLPFVRDNLHLIEPAQRQRSWQQPAQELSLLREFYFSTTSIEKWTPSRVN